MNAPYGLRLSACVLALVTVGVGRAAMDPLVAFAERDSIFSDIAIQHLQDVVLHGGDWTATPLAWPLTHRVTQTDWMFGQALVGLPLRAFDVDPLRIYTAVALLGLFTTALACDRLAAAMLDEGFHTWIAALVGGFAPAQVLHAHHVNLVWHAFGPVAALLLVTGLRRDRPALAAMGAASGFLGFHFGVYVGMHALVILVVVAMFAGRYARGSRRAWAGALAGGIVAAGTLWLPASVYLEAAPQARFGLTELASESVDVARPWMPVLDPLFPGLPTLVLVGVGVYACRRGGWWWAAAGTLGIGSLLLALGPWVQWEGEPLFGPGPLGLLASMVPPIGSLRAPARWMSVAALAAAPFAAAGALRMSAWHRALGPACVVAVVLAMQPVHLVSLGRTEPGPAYAMLAASDVPGPVLDVLGTACDEKGEQKLRAALVHRRPLVGGFYARLTPELAAANRAANGWPAPAAARWLRENDVRLVFDHPPLRAPPADAICEESDGHRLCTLPP